LLKYGRILFCSLIVSISLIFSTFAIAEIPEIQVRIGKNLQKILIEGRNIQRQMLGGKKTQVYQGKKTLEFICKNLHLTSSLFNKFIGTQKNLFVSKVTSTSGILKWNQTPYRGELVIATSENQKSCDLINKVPLENYISSLLAKEMNSNWPLEALKAQAVAARTYAYQKMSLKSNQEYLDEEDSSFDLESSEKHQVGGGFFDETQVTNQAALETKGEVLVAGHGKITPIFYHAKCGGRTFKPDSVWESSVAGYTSVICPYCYKYGHANWKLSLSKKEFLSAVGQVKKLTLKAHQKKGSLVLASDFQDRILLRVYLGEDPILVKKPWLRQVLGRKKLPSNNFRVYMENGKVKFVGRGYGHGVGMCQLGALEMAKQGYDYKTILAHYFPLHRIKKLY